MIDPEISFEISGSARFLVAKAGDKTARERIPLHIWNMDEPDKAFFMKEIITKLKRKMFRLTLSRKKV